MMLSAATLGVFVEIHAVDETAAGVVVVGRDGILSDRDITALTPSALLDSAAIETGSRKDSEPLMPIEPDARKKISAPTFASRFARSRIVPFERPTVKTISKTPTAMPRR